LDFEVSQANAQINTLKVELKTNSDDKAFAINNIARELRQIDLERYVLFAVRPTICPEPLP
jgi:hypothetical protein